MSQMQQPLSLASWARGALALLVGWAAPLQVLKLSGVEGIVTINPVWSTSVFATTTESVLEVRQSPCSDHMFYLGRSGTLTVSDRTGVSFEYTGLVPDVLTWGDHGALGMELHPDFAAGKPYVFIWYATHGDGTKSSCSATTDNSVLCTKGGRLVRLRLQVTIGVDGVCTSIGYDPATDPPYSLLSGFCSTSNTHGIGDIKFYNKTLLLTSGDASQGDGLDVGTVLGDLCYDPSKNLPQGRYRSQRLDYLNGKLLQLDADAILSSDGMLQYPRDIKIVALGLRNPYALAVDESNGNVYVGDVGSSIREEINMLTAANMSRSTPVNFGWPCIEGSAFLNPTAGSEWLQSTATCDPAVNNCSICAALYPCASNPPGTGGCHPDYVGPAFEWRHVVLDTAYPKECAGTSAAIAGLAIFRGDAPQFEPTGSSYMPHNLVAIDYASGCMFTFDRTSATDNTPNFDGGAHLLAVNHFVAALYALPDGYLYSSGPLAPYNIYKHGTITNNDPPLAVLVAQVKDPTATYTACAQTCQVPVGATLRLDATGSKGGGTNVAGYLFDFGDGAAAAMFGPQTALTAEYTYNTVGTYFASLTVTNDGGESAVTSWPVLVGHHVSLSMTPASGGWKYGDTIKYALTASLINLKGSSIVATAAISHCFPNSCSGTPDCHVHPSSVDLGYEHAANGSLTPPEHAMPSNMELIFAVTTPGAQVPLYFNFASQSMQYATTLRTLVGSQVKWWPVFNGELGPCTPPCIVPFMPFYTAPLATNAVQTDRNGLVYKLSYWTSTASAGTFGVGSSSVEALISSNNAIISAYFVPVTVVADTTWAPPQVVAIRAQYKSIELAWEVPAAALMPWNWVLVVVRTAASTNIQDYSATFPVGASTVVVPVPATANTYSVKIAGFNSTSYRRTNWATSYSVTSSGDSTSQLCIYDQYGTYPANSLRPVLPGTIQAENYALGGQKFGYYDRAPGNSGSVTIRQDDVDIIKGGDIQGFGVVTVSNSEWLAYPVTIASAGNYSVAFKLNVAKNDASKVGHIYIQLDKAACTSNIAVGSAVLPAGAKAFSAQALVANSVLLPAGDHTLRFCFSQIPDLRFDSFQVFLNKAF